MIELEKFLENELSGLALKKDERWQTKANALDNRSGVNLKKIIMEEMKRIPLKHGSAHVSKDVKPETVEALNKMVELAYEMEFKPLRLSFVRHWLITRKWLWKKVVFDNGVLGKNYHRYDHRIFTYAEGMGDNGKYGDVSTAIIRKIDALKRACA